MANKFIADVDFSSILKKYLTADQVNNRVKLDNDFVYFMTTIFPDRMKDKYSPKMKEAIEDTKNSLNQVNKNARAFPRGFGKTTTWTIEFSLWVLLTMRIDFLVLVGASQIWMAEQITNLQAELLNNEILREYYGEIEEGDKWAATEFIMKGLFTNPKWEAKVLGLGRTGSVRGRLFKGRPKLVILDDIEKLEEVDNQNLVDKTIRWVANTILKMGDMDTRFLWLGTVLDKDCAFDRVLYGELGFFGKRYSGIVSWSKHQEMWDMWGDYLKQDIRDNDRKLTQSQDFFVKNKNKLLAHTRVLWKQHRPYKYLMYQYYTEGASSFFKEIQNEPKDIKSNYFFPVTVVQPEMKNLVKFLAIDPSLGKIMPSAIICFGFDIHGGKTCYVFDQSTEKRGANDIIKKAIELIKKYDIHRYIVETIQFQDLFKDILKTEVKKAGINAIAIPFSSGEKKESRIEAMQTLINQGRIVFTQNLVGTELWTELLSYPHTRYLDAIDALSMGIAYIKEQLIAQNPAVRTTYTNSQLLYTRSYFDTIDKRDNKNPGTKLAKLIAQKRAAEAEEIKKIFDQTEYDKNEGPDNSSNPDVQQG